MQNQYSVVVGLGKTGYSCVNYLVEQGQAVVVFDTRLDPPLLMRCRNHFPNTTIYLGSIPAEMLAGASRIIISPGIAQTDPSLQPALNAGVPIVGDIQLFAEAVKAPVIGITGTNAKSTVTSLVGEFVKASGFSAQIGGNLGHPVLDMLQNNADLFVLELSSFQLETTLSVHLKTATILNVSPDHLDRYEGLPEYIQAKQRIFLDTENIVINRDDPLSTPPTPINAEVWRFGLAHPESPRDFGIIHADGENYLAQGDKRLLNCRELKIQGRHNWVNALAALALASTVNTDMEKMLEVLRKFPVLTHRCQWVLTDDRGVSWYNDSKGTNIGASLAALEGLAQTSNGKLVLIAGGQGKKQNFADMRDAVAKFTRAVILIGVDAPLLAKAWDGTTLIHTVPTLEAAVLLAKELSTSEDAVLLSPACASFDMFNNYEHRGEAFMQLIRSLT